MPMQAKMVKVIAGRALMVAGLASLVFQLARAQSQSNVTKTNVSAKSSMGAAVDNASKSGASDVAKTLQTAAEAVGLARWSGVGGQRLPEVDVINTMEIWGSGTTYGAGQSNKPGEPEPSFKTEYHSALGYNPPAMRVEMTHTSSGAPAPGGATPLHTIEV